MGHDVARICLSDLAACSTCINASVTRPDSASNELYISPFNAATRRPVTSVPRVRPVTRGKRILRSTGLPPAENRLLVVSISRPLQKRLFINFVNGRRAILSTPDTCRPSTFDLASPLTFRKVWFDYLALFFAPLCFTTTRYVASIEVVSRSTDGVRSCNMPQVEKPILLTDIVSFIVAVIYWKCYTWPHFAFSCYFNFHGPRSGI